MPRSRQRWWQYDWVVEFDIKGAFDHIDHAMLMKALRYHGVEPWIELYVSRWLTASFETPVGDLVEREAGVPQGGVISPLQMNLFMHYTFDVWMQRMYPNSPIVRYADDAVVHCRSRAEAQHVFNANKERLAECKLTMHPEKSKIVYCKDSNRRTRYEHTQFTFLGFTFRARSAISRQGQRFTSFLPAVSTAALKRMREHIKGW
jgi:RNA-directed DNA polymerase